MSACSRPGSRSGAIATNGHPHASGPGGAPDPVLRPLPRIAALGDARLPIGVSLGMIGETVDWWLDGARRLEAAGYAGLWAWDHFRGRGRPKPTLECWTTLTAAAVVTGRMALGTHVLNVMNRHPSVLARMAGTLQALSKGRLVIGLGVGGNPVDHEPLGIPLPPIEERQARLEETVAILRALWTGGPVSYEGQFHVLRDAIAHPVPDPAPPILIAGQSSAGARLAARIGDGWTTRPDLLERLRPAFDEAIVAAGRDRRELTVVVGWEEGSTGVDALRGSPWVEDPRGAMADWRERGADAVILTARTTRDVDALVGAAARW
jgi:alkanesulfonate monooxygenase SsuD/methylene tetrahydromethanopterin reductase-like flavin-dependent oxidoreductase (luciferase family)